MAHESEMRGRQLNRSRPLQAWFVLCLGGTALCATACNAILGNEEGHLVAQGGSTGDAGRSPLGAGGATGGIAQSGGSPSAGAPSAGSPSAGAPSGGSPSAGTSGAGTSSAGIGADGGTGGTAGTGGGTVGPYCPPGAIKTCGGDLKGVWAIQSSCLTVGNDPTIPAACQGAATYQKYKITGNVTYTPTDSLSGTWFEGITNDVQEIVAYSSECITAFHAMDKSFPAPASESNCGTIASNLAQNTGAIPASCTFVDNGCNCSLTFAAPDITTGDSYALTEYGRYLNSKDEHHGVSYCVEVINGVKTLTTSQTGSDNTTVEQVLTLSP